MVKISKAGYLKRQEMVALKGDQKGENNND